jgi:uncharacterized protein YbcI
MWETPMEAMMDNYQMNDNNLIRELRNGLTEAESALAATRGELEDALEREQMVVQYNRELLEKIAQMDEAGTVPINLRQGKQVRQVLGDGVGVWDANKL